MDRSEYMPNPQPKGSANPNEGDIEAEFLEKLTPSAAAAGTLVREGKKRQAAEEAALKDKDTESTRESKRALVQDLRRGVMQSIARLRERMTSKTQVAENMLKEARAGVKFMRKTIGADQVLAQEFQDFLAETEGELNLLEGERNLHNPKSKEGSKQPNI